MKENNQLKSWIKNHSSDLAGYGGLIFCIIVFSILTPLRGESIWSAAKLKTLLSDVIVLALMSVGAVFVYSLGCMDISIGKQLGLYATITVVLGNRTGSLLPGILISLVISAVIGIINGAAGELLHIHSVIASIVISMILGGISSITYNNLGSRNVSLTAVDTHFLKTPGVMLGTLVIEVLAAWFLYRFTRIGKHAKALGTNQLSAQQSGVNVIRYKVSAYVIMGCCVVLASLFQMGYTASSSDSTGTGFEMNVMVALILGGMPLSGGMKSKISCAVIGALTYSLLNVGLPMVGIAANQVNLIKAIIFIIVVLITCRKRDGILPR